MRPYAERLAAWEASNYEDSSQLLRGIDLEFLVQDLPKTLETMEVGAKRVFDIVRSLKNFSGVDQSEMKIVDIHAGIDTGD